jgi:hypothetical protein
LIKLKRILTVFITMLSRLFVCSICLIMTSVAFVSVASAEGKSVHLMTAVQAESELMFKKAISRAGGVNKFDHGRKPATVKTQKIVRSQSDMLYSHGVFDASKGLTVTMPERTTGYHSVHLFDANHAQLGVVYFGETLTVKPGDISTTDKHVYMLMRISTDEGLEVANKAQDSVRVKADVNTPYVGPGYDEEQLAQAKRVLASAVPAGLVKAKTAYANELMPGTVILKDGTDIEKFHYISSSLLGWGLMPNEHAYYPQLGIKENDCTAVNFPNPPVQYDRGGYWSFTAYGMDGYLHTDNSVISKYKAKANADATYTVHVGNSEKCRTYPNHLNMPEGGASITLRLYRPKSISDAKTFEDSFRSDNAGK